MSFKRGVEVEVSRLDSLCINPVDLIKIDVEGFEFDVLLGAQETILRDRPIICLELNGLGKRYGIGDEMTKRTMQRMGYKQVERQNKDYIYAPE
jgi:hypothetical protein